MYYCLNRKETDPYFNLAAEEYALKEVESDLFMVWRNEPSVIIGKHQNAAREINHDFVRSARIPVIRRITGGGTVYHDPGNVNYSFITRGESGHQINFRKYTAPVIDFLSSIGVQAHFEGKNNLFAGGRKISGNAAHVFKDRALHHGTLLFDSDLEVLENSILSNEELYSDKSVRSIRNGVINIKSLLDKELTTEEFSNRFFRFMTGYLPDTLQYEWSDDDRKKIEQIKEEKYLKWEWNRGYSPDYLIRNFLEYGHEHFILTLKVSKGIIETFTITTAQNETTKAELLELQAAFTGLKHDRNIIEGQTLALATNSGVAPALLEKIINRIF